MRLVLVEWMDAFSTDDWTKMVDLRQEPDKSKSLCRTVGWLAHDGAEFKTVVSTMDFEDGSGTMSIPTACIIRIQDYIDEPIGVGNQ